MTRALKGLASAGMTLLVLLAALGFFFDWNVVAAWNWFFGAISWLFNWFVDFFMNSEIFRGIFS